VGEDEQSEGCLINGGDAAVEAEDDIGIGAQTDRGFFFPLVGDGI